MIIHAKLLSNLFVGTGPVPSSNGMFCASILLGTITDVYSTSTRAEGPIPENPSLVTLTANSLRNPTAWADIVQVRWQETDTQILAIISSEASLRTSSQASTRPQSTMISSTGKESLPAYGGTSSSILSTGAKAGIGIGVAIMVLCVFGGFLLIWWKKRQHSAALSKTHTGNTLDNGAQIHELDRQHNEQPLKGELDGRPIEVADRQNVAAELSS